MRVLMTSDAVGGVWTYALELAAGLAKHGVTTTLATMGPPPGPDQQQAAQAIPGLRLRSSSYRLEWMDDPWEDVREAGAWLLELADAERADLVHLNGYAHGALPFRVPVVVVAHSCVFTWWRAVLGHDPPPRYHRYHDAVRRGLQAADAVVAPTHAFLESLLQVYRGPFRHTRVVYNGVDPSPFSQAQKAPVVLAAGRLWDPAKNLTVLDAAARRIPWPVQVAGDPEPPDGIRDAEPSGVELLGRLPRASLVQRMARASILCHPARYEPFGLVPLEAAAAGCALVLADIPTLREVWGPAADYVPPDDPDALASAIQRLIDRPEARRSLANLARRRAARYRVDQQTRAYLALYDSLREDRRRPARTATQGVLP